MRELIARLSAHPWLLGQLVVASVLLNTLGLASSIYTILVLNQYVSHGITGTLVTLSVGVVLAVAFEFGLRRTRMHIAATIGSESDQQLNEGAVGLILTARLPELEAIPMGQRSELLSGLRRLDQMYSPANIASLLDVPFIPMFLLALGLLSWQLALIAIAFIGLVAASGYWTRRALEHQHRQFSRLAAEDQALTHSANHVTETVRCFSTDALLMEQWQATDARLRSLRQRIQAQEGNLQNITQGAQTLLSVGIIGWGAPLVVAGELSVGALIGANILAARSLAPVSRFMHLLEPLGRARETTTQLQRLLKLPTETEQGHRLPRYQGSLSADQVSFSWPGQSTPVLAALDFQLAPGQVMAVTGNNGSGKTTLAKLLLGLYPPTKGRILVDDINLAGLNPRWWRDQILYLPQEPLFLNTSLRRNLTRDRADWDDDALWQVLQRVGLHSFVADHPQGLARPLTQLGQDLSPGQRRRLALARALLTDGQLVVFDEPTEGLDNDGIEIVYRIMIELAQHHKTLVIMTHDPKLISGAGLQLDLTTQPARVTKL